jgi:formate dehydrogenase subunit gamma
LKRFNRWTADDRRWIGILLWGGAGRIRRLAQLNIGKFNPGQKLNAAFVAGAGLVLLATGVVMRWYHPYPLSWRTGATFVHDWLAVAVGLVILGHIGMALRDPDAMRSMVHGEISSRWAARHAPAWLSGEDSPAPGDS